MKRILICEDEPDAAASLSSYLMKRDYAVAAASDGRAAVELAERFEPDLILLDIRMPKLNGLEVAQEIRTFNTAARIIFITAFHSPELAKEAAVYDVSAFISKPAGMDEIVRAIRVALGD